MGYYIKKSTNQYPLFEGDIRLEHPEIGDEFICPDTYAYVEDAPTPEYDMSLQKIKYGNPVEENGKWLMTFIIEDYTKAELDAIAQAQAEYELQQLNGE